MIPNEMKGVRCNGPRRYKPLRGLTIVRKLEQVKQAFLGPSPQEHNARIRRAQRPMDPQSLYAITSIVFLQGLDSCQELAPTEIQVEVETTRQSKF
jgi:hypothetical protein